MHELRSQRAELVARVGHRVARIKPETTHAPQLPCHAGALYTHHGHDVLARHAPIPRRRRLAHASHATEEPAAPRTLARRVGVAVMDDPIAHALNVAERVSDAFARRGHPAAIIGATAMAMHGYPRATRDVDLGVLAVPLATLREVAAELRAAGFTVSLGEPDLHDPLGGVLRVELSDELQIDVVNFGNPHTGAGRRVGAAALGAKTLPIAGRRLVAVDVAPLVLLKLAAGRRLDLRDAAELLTRHPEIDRAALRVQCASLRLDRRLERVLADVDEAPDTDPLP